MTNFKQLKIEKEMQEEFSNYDKSSLERLMESCYFENPFITERKNEASYCMIEVVDCLHDEWWYSKLIGLEFFCRIEFEKRNDNTSKIKEFVGVKLYKNKEIIFRTFAPCDVLIL